MSEGGGAPPALTALPALPGAQALSPARAGGASSEAVVSGAAQVAAAYVAAGNRMRPDEVVALVSQLRAALR